MSGATLTMQMIADFLTSVREIDDKTKLGLDSYAELAKVFGEPRAQEIWRHWMNVRFMANSMSKMEVNFDKPKGAK